MKVVIEIEGKTYSFERKRPEYDSDVLLEDDVKDIAKILCLAIKSAGMSPAYLANQILQGTEKTSDGYHTFQELYDQRAVLWAALARCYPGRAWKSWRHEDGTMFDGMFIAGIKTPEGQYTFHIDAKWWSEFDIKEIPNAPHWDGHKPEDIVRIKSLRREDDEEN